jgi:hypothetical protein
VEASAASVTPAVLNNGSNPNVVELIGEGLLSMFGSGGRSPPQPVPSGVGQPARVEDLDDAAQEERMRDQVDPPPVRPEDAESNPHMGEQDAFEEESFDDRASANGEPNVDDVEDVDPDPSGDAGSKDEMMTMMGQMAEAIAKLAGELEALKSSPSAAYRPYSIPPSSPAPPFSPTISVADVVSAFKASTAERSEGRWMVKESDSIEFMSSSKAPALAEHNTRVRVSEVIDATPTSKVETKAFQASIDATTLFGHFLDTLTHHEYVDRRKELVVEVAVMANLHKDRADGIKAADRLVNKAIKALDVTKDGEQKQMMAKIQRSVIDHGRNGKPPSVATILYEMDLEFGKVTAMERDHEIKNQLNAISILKHVPSVMLSMAYSLYTQQYQSIPDASVRHRVVLRDVQSLVSEKIRASASQYDWMMPFRQKLLDTGFQQSTMAEWVAQFKVYEATPEFQRGQEAARAGSVDPRRAAVPKTKSVSAVHESDDETEVGSISAIGELRETIAELKSKIASMSNPSTGGFLSWRTFEWVTKFGVAGYPPPGDSQRKAIMVGLIWRKAGVPISPSCPKEPTALVGFHCPCNHSRKIPEELWFYHPDSKQFKDGANATPPPGVKGFGWMHALGKCMHAYAEGHKLARADPANKRLLEPLPQGCGDCIGTSQ